MMDGLTFCEGKKKKKKENFYSLDCVRYFLGQTSSKVTHKIFLLWDQQATFFFLKKKAWELPSQDNAQA